MSVDVNLAPFMSCACTFLVTTFNSPLHVWYNSDNILLSNSTNTHNQETLWLNTRPALESRHNVRSTHTALTPRSPHRSPSSSLGSHCSPLSHGSPLTAFTPLDDAPDNRTVGRRTGQPDSRPPHRTVGRRTGKSLTIVGRHAGQTLDSRPPRGQPDSHSHRTTTLGVNQAEIISNISLCVERQVTTPAAGACTVRCELHRLVSGAGVVAEPVESGRGAPCWSE